MALLVFFTFLMLNFVAMAQSFNPQNVGVLFDSGNPQASVGIVQGELMEAEDIYEGHRIDGFEPDAILFKDLYNGDLTRTPVQGEIDAGLWRQARHLFVVKQLKALYVAQWKYYDRFRDTFAPDVRTLVHYGFLAHGFQDWVKQEYFFQIFEAGEAKRWALMPQKSPTFIALAEPRPEISGNPYFSVDQAGLVRYADSRQHSIWGPAWDYAETSPVPYQEILLEDDAWE